MTNYQYAFLNVPELWENELFGVVQFNPLFTPGQTTQKEFKSLKFGYAIERIIGDLFQNSPAYKLIASNVQVNGLVRTLGEMDFIVAQREQVYHIESAFKFYLFDPNVNHSAYSEWIGANRKDSFLRKIEHIKNQQFPLLQTPEARLLFSKMGLAPDKICQRVIFKALLFTPYGKNVALKALNSASVVGTYFHFDQMDLFQQDKFYIVQHKLDWIISPHANVPWEDIKSIKFQLHPKMSEERSVYIWRKDPKGNLSRHFVTWW